MYFMKAIGPFSTDTVRGLINMYARGFITITRVSHPLQNEEKERSSKRGMKKSRDEAKEE